MMPAAVMHQDAMNEIVLLKARLRELEAALRQARPYVDQARCADAAELEAQGCTLRLIDAAFPEETPEARHARIVTETADAVAKERGLTAETGEKHE